MSQWGSQYGNSIRKPEPLHSGEGKDDWVEERGNSPWRSPTPEDHKERAFRDSRLEDDPAGRKFTTRKKHGWWGREEYYDVNGKKIG